MQSSYAKRIERELIHKGSPSRALLSERFFKTGKGEYGEGDVFLGVNVPTQRVIAKKYYTSVTLSDLVPLLRSSYHECRLTALIILTLQYKRADDAQKKVIYDFLIKHRSALNNWDLVDIIVPKIIGEYLRGKDTSLLYTLARSESLWERRIAIISTFAFIRRGDFKDTLTIAEVLVEDREDLIQKAVGWMLREVGKKDLPVEEAFLQKNKARMGRTTLRYAIERFDESKRQHYLRT